MNDDAKGDPMSFNAHPEHASWAEVEEPNCYPDSEIRRFHCTLDMYANYLNDTKEQLIKFSYALISCAFPEDLDAKDELSGLTLKEILELQHESTDRQCYPLWNGNKMLGTGTVLPANVPGMTTNQQTEDVAWDPSVVKDQLRYGKLKALLRKQLPIGVRTSFMNIKKSNHKRIKFGFLPSSAKFINPYTFLGLMVYFHKSSSTRSISSSL